MRHPTDRLVKRGTFLYDDSVRCVVEIWQTSVRPGSGDEADEPEFAADAHGTFYEIRYASAGSSRITAGGGWHDSLEAAIEHVRSVTRDVRWDEVERT